MVIRAVPILILILLLILFLIVILLLILLFSPPKVSRSLSAVRHAWYVQKGGIPWLRQINCERCYGRAHSGPSS